MRTYKGFTIEDKNIQGWWTGSNIVDNRLVTFKTDTLAGMRQVISEFWKNHKGN